MKILHAAFGFIDVFTGMEWDNHTRLRSVKSANGSRLIHISGNRLTQAQLAQVNKEIAKK